MPQDVVPPCLIYCFFCLFFNSNAIVIWIVLFLIVYCFFLGNPTVEVSSCPGGNVLLSCSCKMRDLSEPFRWQMANNKEPVSVLREGEENLTEDFKGRVESFYKENPSNCSILLKNVTYIHHGIYTCYYRSGTFIYTSVNLHVYGKEILHLYIFKDKVISILNVKTYKISVLFFIIG